MKIFFLLLLFIPFSFTQNISTLRVENIINNLLTNSSGISDYIFSDEFQISNRFGIEYEGVKNKFLIANVISEELSGDLIKDDSKYEYEIKNLEDHFSLLTFIIPSMNIKRDYFLKDSFIVSSTYYHSCNWKTITSDYFKFFISDKTLFNDYSIKLLENFVVKMFNDLCFTEDDKNLLKEKKIFYFLCRDEDEIQKVTGFTTRGIYILAQDYIITTYNTHYHELLHFLINFKLRKLPLYTHPFLQEGFAVAFGGRGGLEAHTIFELGVFLIKSGFFSYVELLKKSGFLKTDASMSYPVSGIYTSFLIRHIGISNYLQLYMKYSGSSEKVLSEEIKMVDLLPEEQWKLYIDSLLNQNPIKIKEDIDVADFKSITKQKDFEIYKSEDEYFFKIKDTLLIKTSESILNYQSKIFKQSFLNRKYDSEKYLIIANQNEVSVYNLFSNNLIGKYVASFSLPPKTVPIKDDFYEFVIKKNLFDEELKDKFFIKSF